jgi:sacsin
MCEALGDWQGPAIWFYNSVPAFTSNDLDCFTRSVGDSAKAGNSGKIGQFGLGAITAYHFTDVIQLLSGSVTLTLAPNASAASLCTVTKHSRPLAT